MIETKEIRLNLGARNKPVEGFLGMDIDPHDGIDFVGDVSDLSRFKDESVSEILASHILEHFPHPRTLAVLREWHRVLISGGRLLIAVPDLSRAMDIYKKFGQSDWLIRWLWGDQEYKTAYHYVGFDEDRLTGLLLSAGFSDVFRVEELPSHAEKDCSSNVFNMDGLPVSLNMVATK